MKRMEKSKRENFYMLHHQDHGFIAICCSLRKDLIYKATLNYGLSWKELKQRGYSAKKVLVKEVK